MRHRIPKFCGAREPSAPQKYGGPATNDWVGALSKAHGATCATESHNSAAHVAPCAIESHNSVAHVAPCTTELWLYVAHVAPCATELWFLDPTPPVDRLFSFARSERK